MNPRDLSLKALRRLSHNPSFSDRIVRSYLDKNPELSEKDRAFFVNLVQGVIRWKLRIDWIIQQFLDFSFKKLDPDVLNILRIAVYQIFFMDRVPDYAAVNEAVNQAKRKRKDYITATVNAVLRSIVRGKNRIRYPDRKKDPVKFLSVFYSYPEWLVKKWIKELGEDETEKLLSAQNRLPHITLRVNRKKISREELVNIFLEEGIKASFTKYSPDGIKIEKLQRPIDSLELYKEGFFFVQDEASQLCSYLLNPRQGEEILDICAGFGGKSFHIAELIEGKGRIIALDISLKRLLILAKNLSRYGFEKVIFPVSADATCLSNVFRCLFDRILIDAPCSGLGTILRHPDIKWTKSEEDIKKLSEIQKKMLDQASYLLKEGGRLLYVTCTISEEENEKAVEYFLERHPEMTLVDLKKEVPWLKDLIDEKGFFRSYPHIHDMDGFFCALFEKRRKA